MKVYRKYPPPWRNKRPISPYDVIAYLQARSEVTDAGCWLWRGSLQSQGYGVVEMRGRRYLAHRLALAAKLKLLGKYLGKKFACHQCETPAKHCCNPDHLERGDQSRNMREWHISRRNKPREIFL